jgi:hypothetical protein
VAHQPAQIGANLKPRRRIAGPQDNPRQGESADRQKAALVAGY